MPRGKGDRVAPPRPPGGWEVRYADKAARDGWEELCRQVPNAAYKAWEALSTRPTNPENRDRQHPLKGKVAGTRAVNGGVFDQWQYEITGGGRVWYCPDPDKRIVWLTLAGTGHPKSTE